MKESEFNFYGIVLSFTVPKLTRKGEWMVTISVFDDTITTEERNMISSLTMTLFNRNKDSLPKTLCAGGIIRCHRMLTNVSLDHKCAHKILYFHHLSDSNFSSILLFS